MIYCPNPSCQTPNSETNRFCQVCHTALPHRYLWAVGKDLDELEPGDLLADRYQLKQGRIFLDTKPGIPPESFGEIPASVFPYLHLSIYPLQVPRPYCFLTFQLGKQTRTVLLLEEAAIRTDFNASDTMLDRTIVLPKPQETTEITTEIFSPKLVVAVELLPTLQQGWESASSLRQLNWLWQIAKLWQHFQLEQVASSLITPKLLRVDGSILRLLELSRDQSDSRSSPTLSQLGQSWMPLIKTAQPGITTFLQELCQQLCHDQFKTTEQLVTCLDAALDVCGQGQNLEFKLATYTDQGPTRQRNEDACFPPSGSVNTYTIGAGQTRLPHPIPLLIVCDGIGGHESGDVASKLAIEVIQKALQPLLKQAPLAPTTLMVGLEREICAANDAISQRNDQEQRSARERMGTTLVMAFLHGYELYLAHIGDSRAYRISPFSCRQATLDDDVATREVRLGYGFYRDALQQPGAGSLVQALGMGSSQSLYPTVQRFILDEDSIFLLCSDGLSDNDQVETFWPTEILPVFEGQQTFTVAGRRLIEVANTYNGHDNVTVGLIQIQITQSSQIAIHPELAIPKALPPPKLAQKSTPAQTAPAQSTSARSTPEQPTPTQSVPAQPTSSQPTSSQPTSSQSRSTQSASAKPTPTQSTSAQSTSAQSAPAKPTSAQSKSARSAPAQSKPVRSPFAQPASNESVSVVHSSEPTEQQQPLWPLLLGIALLLLIGGGMVYFFIFGLYSPVARKDHEEITIPQSDFIPPSTPIILPGSDAKTAQPLTVGSFIQISRSTTNAASGASAKPLTLQARPGSVFANAASGAPESETINGVIPAGGILKILNKQEVTGQGQWVRLKVCSIPSGSNSGVYPTESASEPSGLTTQDSSSALSEYLFQPGEEGWILESLVRPVAQPTTDLVSSQKGSCNQE